MRRYGVQICLVLALTGCGESAVDTTSAPDLAAEIRWTSYGIPHVKADDWAGLGFGFAYATATDALCVIARDLVMVNGELARYFGPGDGNLSSDVFHRSVLTDELLTAQLAGEDEDGAEFSRGYVAGFNRFLKDHAGELPQSCAGSAWVTDIDARDLARLTVGVGIRYGLGRFKEAMANASPPGEPVAALQLALDQPTGIGSNAVAIGKSLSTSGRGILLGNPHYPWRGSSRFHMIHTTIPGELDVMGASLYTTTRIGIGFNNDVAWTHTVSTALRFTFYQLDLHPENPLRYRYGNEYRDLRPISVSVELIDADGQLTTKEQTTWYSHYGPVVVSDELPWNQNVAYAVRDAVIDNHQASITYRDMHKATSVAELEAALSHQGVYWTNTIAADRHGNAFYADISGTPNVDEALLEHCRVESDSLPGRAVVLNGADPACEWHLDARSTVPGALPAAGMPRLTRDDYVHNANDSYWLSNPDAPLEGYSPIIGNEREARSLRTRAGLVFIDEYLAANKLISAEDLQQMLYSQRNFGAELLLDDLLKLCIKEPNPEQLALGDIQPACLALAGWDRKQNSDSRGAQVWTEFWRTARDIEGVYQQSFDPARPVTTPSGLAIDDPQVATALYSALINAEEILDAAGITLDAAWGDVQYAERNGQRIPIPGGQGWAGMWSVITANLEADRGYTPIIHGNSYIQVISWDKDGSLEAQGILTYSQSEEPESPHYADQTHLFSKGQWISLPFTEGEINADPNLKILELTQ